MYERLVFSAPDVVPFSPPGLESVLTSRLLIDEESTGSDRLVANLFTLKPGNHTVLGSHPAPHDELYYVLGGSGRVCLGVTEESYPITRHSVVFIPHGTLHSVENLGDDDLQLLTVMPGPMERGANSIYDARKDEWGRTIRHGEASA